MQPGALRALLLTSAVQPPSTVGRGMCDEAGRQGACEPAPLLSASHSFTLPMASDSDEAQAVRRGASFARLSCIVIILSKPSVGARRARCRSQPGIRPKSPRIPLAPESWRILSILCVLPSRGMIPAVPSAPGGLHRNSALVAQTRARFYESWAGLGKIGPGSTNSCPGSASACSARPDVGMDRPELFRFDQTRGGFEFGICTMKHGLDSTNSGGAVRPISRTIRPDFGLFMVSLFRARCLEVRVHRTLQRGVVLECVSSTLPLLAPPSLAVLLPVSLKLANPVEFGSIGP